MGMITILNSRASLRNKMIWPTGIFAIADWPWSLWNWNRWLNSHTSVLDSRSHFNRPSSKFFLTESLKWQVGWGRISEYQWHAQNVDICRIFVLYFTKKDLQLFKMFLDPGKGKTQTQIVQVLLNMARLNANKLMSLETYGISRKRKFGLLTSPIPLLEPPIFPNFSSLSFM